MATFVLVHGAWLGAWVWKKVTPLLRAKGHDVYSLALTGMGERSHLASRDHGIETAISDVVNIIDFQELTDVVLVGHSFAGKVVGAVADRVPDRIKMIIYLDAGRPEKIRGPQGSFDPRKEFGEQPPDSFTIPLTKEIVEMIGSDLEGENLKWILSKATPWPIKLGIDPISLTERFDNVRSAYIFCSRSGDPVDEILEGKWGKLYGPAKVIDSGHWPMISKAHELADALISLAEAK